MAYVQGLGSQGATLGVMARSTRSPVGGRVVTGCVGSARNGNNKLHIATASGRSSGQPIRVGGPPSKRGRRAAVSYTEDTKYTDTDDRKCSSEPQVDDVLDATVVPEPTSTTTTMTSTSTTTSVEKTKEHYGREWHTEWIGKILKYGLPAMSIPVADPLLTMVDTLFVGQFCTVQELASLGPNGTVFPVMAYSFSFLSIAAIQRISSAAAEGRTQDVGHLMRQAMLLSVVLGVALMIGAEMFAPQILKAVATNAEMFEPALLYMRIRCLAQPAVLFCSVAQSGLLGLQDSMSALYSIVLMCLINVVGDWLMVGCWGMGIGGSAWATVASAYGAAVALAWAWSRRPDCENPFKDVRFPDMQELTEFCSGFGVLWGISTLDTLCYGCVRVGATALGTLPCAAYTALYSLWMPLSFMSMPLRQSAMVFLPQFMTTSTLKGKCSTLNSEGKQVFKVLMGLGGLFGLVAGLLVAAPAVLAPGMFTEDVEVLRLIRTTAFPALMALLVSGFLEVVEGVLLVGNRADTQALLQSVGVTVVLLNVLLFGCTSYGLGLAAVWWALVTFYILRVLQPGLYILTRTFRSQADRTNPAV